MFHKSSTKKWLEEVSKWIAVPEKLFENIIRTPERKHALTNLVEDKIAKTRMRIRQIICTDVFHKKEILNIGTVSQKLFYVKFSRFSTVYFMFFSF